jgi:hypothetical protein
MGLTLLPILQVQISQHPHTSLLNNRCLPLHQGHLLQISIGMLCSWLHIKEPCCRCMVLLYPQVCLYKIWGFHNWRFSLKCRYPCILIHGVITQKCTVWIFTIAKTSHLGYDTSLLQIQVSCCVKCIYTSKDEWKYCLWHSAAPHNMLLTSGGQMYPTPSQADYGSPVSPAEHRPIETARTGNPWEHGSPSSHQNWLHSQAAGTSVTKVCLCVVDCTGSLSPCWIYAHLELYLSIFFNLFNYFW